MFERQVDCPRCKEQVTLRFWDYSPAQGYQHISCPHCGGEAKFGLTARLAGVAAVVAGLALIWLVSRLTNKYVSLVVGVLALPVLFAAFGRPFVTLEPTDVGRKLERLQPFFILMAVLCAGLVVARFLGFRP